jgi:hypothetical protein
MMVECSLIGHNRRHGFGRINNEHQPHLKREILPEEREIGIVNNEHEPHLSREVSPEEQEIGLINNSKHA